jgi:hypothetical protein
VKATPSLVRHGINYDLQVIVFEPLFEEYNRTKRLLSEVSRRLNEMRLGVTFCELPGMGESLVDISEARLADWRAAAAAAITEIQPTMIASIRGGSLLDDAGPAKGVWRFAPETGTRIVRDLRRTQLAGETDLYAGHRLSDAFLADLESAAPAQVRHLRIARLETDVMAADIKLAGAPLWRRAEPGEDATLATAIASDLVDWTRICAGY